MKTKTRDLSAEIYDTSTFLLYQVLDLVNYCMLCMLLTIFRLFSSKRKE